MLALSDTGQLLRFVQRDNLADLRVGRAALERAGRYSVSAPRRSSRRTRCRASRLLPASHCSAWRRCSMRAV